MRLLVQVLTKDHARDHMMSEILPPGGNLAGAFGGASSRGCDATCNLREADIFGEFSSFSCPYCGIGGFNEAGLAEHCTNDHAGDGRPVVCPICAVRPGAQIRSHSSTNPASPGGDPSLISADFMGHLGMRHAASRFVPNTEDQSDEEEVRAIALFCPHSRSFSRALSVAEADAVAAVVACAGAA